MNFCENVNSCTADECTDFLCFDSATGILTANPPDEWWATLIISVAYCAIRVVQLWLGSLYWQKERELLSVKKDSRDWSAIKTQTLLQFGRSILSTLGFYLLIQQSLYLFVALIFLDTVFVPFRLIKLQKKDNTHPVQNVLVELWHMYDEAHQKINHTETLDQLGKLIDLMKEQYLPEVEGKLLPVTSVNSSMTRRNLLF